MKRSKREPVKKYPDGREVCDLKTRAGKEIYLFRLSLMITRQHLVCAICRTVRAFFEFDHEAGRGSGGAHRDDRIEVDGHWQNAALCVTCNREKGSKRYHWVDNQYVPVVRP